MINKLLIIILGGLSFTLNAQEPTLDWAISIGGSGIEQMSNIIIDNSGDLCFTGIYEGTVDFDPGPLTLNFTSMPYNGSGNLDQLDIFIEKLDSNGNLVWATSMGGNQPSIGSCLDFGSAIATDQNGNIYIGGSFQGTVDFDPGPGTYNLTSIPVTSSLTSCNYSQDLFILKLDASYNLVWAKSISGAMGWKSIYSIRTDNNGNVYSLGSYEGTSDFDPGLDTLNLTPNGDADIFIQKLDPIGNLLWIKSFDLNTQIWIASLATDLNGNTYVTGFFEDTVDFDPGVSTLNLTSAGGADIFIQKLDSNGNLVWAKSMGSTGHDIGYSNTIDASGNVYTTGRFNNTVDFDPGTGITNLTSINYDDIFIQKLDSNGNLIWVKSMGGTSSEEGRAITTDASGNVYTTGKFWNTVDFDPGPGITNLTSNGSDDIFIQKLDVNGDLVWVISYGASSQDVGHSIITDNNGNVYVGGSFRNTIDFDPGPGFTTLTSNGNYDIFLLKLKDISTTFILENSFEKTPLIYPNPSDGDFTIDLGNTYESITIKLTDLNGKLIETNYYNNTQLLQLKIKEPVGIYLIHIETDSKKAIIKLIKE